MIEQLAAQARDPLNLRAHVADVLLVSNGLVDVSIGGNVVTMLPMLKDIGTFSAFGGDRVLVYELGDSWVVGAILPTEVVNVIPEGLLDVTDVGALPEGWTSSATSSWIGSEFALVEDATLAHSGDRVLTATDPTPYTTGGRRFVYLPPVQVTEGEQYIAHVYYRKNDSMYSTTMECAVYTGATRRKAIFDTTFDPADRIDLAGELSNTDQWQDVGGTLTVPWGHSWLSLGVRLTADNSGAFGATHYLDDFILRLA